LLPDELLRFQLSFLEALRWLAAAGIVHRGLSPFTVRWDSGAKQVQITDFSLATVVGAPRTVAGRPPWASPEQQIGRGSGSVTNRDDIWAAGHLLYLVVTGDRLTQTNQLARSPDLESLLGGVFGPPDHRPSALDLLKRLPAQDPVPRGIGGDPLKAGRDRFFAIRAEKHPGATPARYSGPDPGSPQSPGVSSGPVFHQDPPNRPARGGAPRGASKRRRRWPMGLAAGSLVVILALIGLMAGVVR
jgi:serine/threonine protein kinase